MDPTATFRLMLEALEDNDSEAYADAWRDLRSWLRRGGFAPKIQPHELEFLLETIHDLL